jgi:hypothetical protein
VPGSWRSRYPPWRNSYTPPHAGSARSPSATRAAGDTARCRCRAGARRPARNRNRYAGGRGRRRPRSRSRSRWRACGRAEYRPRRVSPEADRAGRRCASLAAIPIDVSMAASSITPPSEVRRPPSNRAVTFLRCTDGSENASRLSSIMAGVEASDSAEVGFDTKISAGNQLFTLHPLANR